MAQTTKKALAASLKKLLEKTTLDKITVKDIANDCEVNRQTFYYHFQDVYALLEWIFLTEAAKVIANNKTYDTWQQGYLQAFLYVEQNKTLVVNAYHSIGREHLDRYLYSVAQKLLMDVVNEKAEGLHVAEEDKQFIADFYKYAFVGLMLEWIRTGMKERPEDIIDKLSKLITGDIHRALLKYEQ
ncbi:TetR/AcrR family transcriptional regulator [Geosporobacter ferrireducens]|uniref:Dihydroxyacetone kinase transcriptional activator DhaS n=1 Tax=Geosporobacter ferrireducens TaxID=1424294 RepID=A0A1D8GMA9_9FIRM|nr:TetR-like C-terminal domain-containing protein [Geosporobacter ferrireducens]AOT72053.1 dihydroxyacetone kinase transcriptional activator DhaS [Geosporobacter ferrireducens]MTI55937.1 TetR family transcriptional regulator [Geosporobacter ferrireducens]